MRSQSELFVRAAQSRSRGALPARVPRGLRPLHSARLIRGSTTRSSPVISAWSSPTGRRCCCSHRFRGSARVAVPNRSFFAAHDAAASVVLSVAGRRRDLDADTAPKCVSAGRRAFCFDADLDRAAVRPDVSAVDSVYAIVASRRIARPAPRARTVRVLRQICRRAAAGGGRCVLGDCRACSRWRDRRMHSASAPRRMAGRACRRVVAIRFRDERRVRGRVPLDRRARSPRAVSIANCTISSPFWPSDISPRRRRPCGGFRCCSGSGFRAAPRLRIAWAFAPPGAFLGAGARPPAISVDAPANTRYALMPPMQPLSFGDRGDGLDPNAVVLPHNVVRSTPCSSAFRRRRRWRTTHSPATTDGCARLASANR